MEGFLRDKRNLVILLLSILFVIKIPQENTRFVFWILGGIVSASSCDILINLVFSRRRIIPESAVISGFIVSGILDYHQHWAILIIFSILAVLSKHIIRFKGKHIFNPANFALFAAAFFKIPLTWSIESNVYIIIAAGIYIAWSIKKLPHILGFLFFFIMLFAFQGANPFQLISSFFLFIMLIEPKTSGFGKLRGFIFGGIAGIASFLIFKFSPQHDFFVGSLFIANLFNPLLEKIKR